MSKKFIKLNNNDEHLSLGNLFRIIKDISKNKTSALQTELFCTIFEIDNINDTTVSNYCVGCRGIGGEYKQIYINKEKRYRNNKNEFTDNIIGLLCIIDGKLYQIENNKIDFINQNDSAYLITKKLYNIAKNDKEVDKELCNYLNSLIKNNKIYECLVEELLFIILKKKQPIYEDELKIEVFENILNDTSISSVSLEEYLSLKLREGINYDYAMKELADKGNAYACYEIGSNEYYGFFKGYPRYDVACEYLKKAAEMHHAASLYMIGNMYIKGLIGSQSKEELKQGYEYLLESYDLGNIAASNLLGYMYYNGVYVKKDEQKAIEYFKKAASNNYAFALNNLGNIEEKNNNIEEALKYYLKSADLGESWACNKIAESYRLGIKEKDMKKAFYYYNRALESNNRTLCYYAYYNLAKYFYKNGYSDIAFKDHNKVIEYYSIAASNNCFEALLELFYEYIEEYLNYSTEDNYEIIIKTKELIEKNKNYNNDIKEKIENKIKEITKEKINLNILNKGSD